MSTAYNAVTSNAMVQLNDAFRDGGMIEELASWMALRLDQGHLDRIIDTADQRAAEDVAVRLSLEVVHPLAALDPAHNRVVLVKGTAENTGYIDWFAGRYLAGREMWLSDLGNMFSLMVARLLSLGTDCLLPGSNRLLRNPRTRFSGKGQHIADIVIACAVLIKLGETNHSIDYREWAQQVWHDICNPGMTTEDVLQTMLGIAAEAELVASEEDNVLLKLNSTHL